MSAAHVAYPSFLHANARTVTTLEVNGLGSIPWIATEKIHGSNFGLTCTADAPDVVVKQTRNQVLTEADTFHKHQTAPDLRVAGDKVRALFALVRADAPSVQRITCFGEYYGAGIQRGVRYGAACRFVCFDVYVELAAERHYEAYDTVAALCARVDLPCVSAKLSGYASLRDLVAAATTSKNTQTTEWARPDDGGNPQDIAEGYVLRPRALRYVVPSGDAHRGDRPMLKIVHDKFKESITHGTAVTKGAEFEAALEAALGHVTVARYEAVRSKYLEDARVDILANALADDALEDIHGQSFWLLQTEPGRKKMGRAVRDLAFGLVKGRRGAVGQDRQ
jgi:Rnl2 family RNA ligase